jgi:aerobic carbon-monoxide dehydrogenase medium subunit
MMPALFEYVRVESVEEAIAALAEREGEARLLAGGQSLVPMLNMRLLQPEAVVDVNRVPGLSEIREEEGQVTIGALTRYCQVEWSPVVGSRLPLLTEAVGYVGDRQVRSRGTIGGALAHADPTGEVALVALTLGATVVVRGPEGTRELPADELLLGPYFTSLELAEMITAVRFPYGRTVSAIVEHARKHGDFCVIGVAAVGEPENGGWKSIRIGLSGVSPTPFVGAELSDTRLEADVVEQAAAACVEAADPSDDVRASADYRRHLIPIYIRRALRELERRRA